MGSGVVKLTNGVCIVGIAACLVSAGSDLITPVRDEAGTGAAPTPAAPAPVDWTPLLWIAGSAVTLVVVVLGTMVLVGFSAATRQPDTRVIRRIARQETRADQLARWQKAVDAHASVAASIVAFEVSDPAYPQQRAQAFFERPLLGDVTEPASATFWEAWAAANDAHLETAPHDEALITAFVDAVRAARLAYEAADRNARRKARDHVVAGGRQLTSDQVRRLARARHALDLACDPATTAGEAANAWQRVVVLVAGILTIPDPITTTITGAIEAGARTAIAARG